MEQDIFVTLLAKKLFGEISAEEKQLLNNIIKNDSQKLYEYHFMMELCGKENNQSVHNDNVDDAWEAHYKRYERDLKRGGKISEHFFNRVTVRWLVAAVMAVFIAVISLIYFKNKREVHLYSTENNEQKKIILPDGSTVILNANSQITYNDQDFGKKSRIVQMDGEVYFDVIKNKGLPFLVKVHDVSIRVLGTAFDVKAYNKQNKIETSLFRGKIEMTLTENKRHTEKVILLPNEKAVVGNNNVTVSKNKNDISTIKICKIKQVSMNGKTVNRDTAWLQKQLLLDNQTFASFAEDLADRYGKQFVIQDSSVASYIYSGSIPTVSLEKVLDALSSIQSFHYKINHYEVIITK